jgi:hypothetical protein
MNTHTPKSAITQYEVSDGAMEARATPGLTPFDEQDTEALRILGFTVSVTRNSELAVLFMGERKIVIYRQSGPDDQLVLVITMLGGHEIVATIPRETLWDGILDDAP